MNYEYIPDPIERGEASIEHWYYENLQPDGRLKCYCGRLFDLKDAVDSGPSPWAIPMCPTCGKEKEKEYEDHQQKSSDGSDRCDGNVGSNSD